MVEPRWDDTTGNHMTNVLRIANASGYWGDDLTALRRQIEGGPLDFVTMDFLAEITMSIMQKQRARKPELGYARDFVDQMADVLGLAMEQGVTIIANAGGVAPRSCGDAIAAVLAEQGLNPRVGVVAGDDLMDRLGNWHADGVAMDNMDDGRTFGAIVDQVSSANAYFGAAPVVRAIEEGAQVIVTGRVTDTGITLAPMMERFGWAEDDWDKLASGIIAGHILECGAQSTGGNYTDWREIDTFHNIGYPIVEVRSDGSFIVTKHEGTGGAVTAKSVKEQLVYEMGDPSAYLTPDVTVDFGSINVEQVGPDRVEISGVRGAAPTDLLKVSMSHTDGYKATGSLMVCGPDARAKSEAFADILFGRLPEFEHTLTEYVGGDSTWGGLSPAPEPAEVLLRCGVRDHDRAKIGEFSKMLAAVVLSGPPGVAVTGGRPAIQEVVAYWPCLIPRELCSAEVSVFGGDSSPVDETVPFKGATGPGRVEAGSAVYDFTPVELTGNLIEAKLADIAHGRSGDKGDTCNIGVIARHPAIYPWLVDNLTAQRVKHAFAGICHGEVERFEVPNIEALNFLLHESLGGGGTLSLHIDAQGKTYSHALLSIAVEIDQAYLDLLG